MRFRKRFTAQTKPADLEPPIPAALPTSPGLLAEIGGWVWRARAWARRWIALIIFGLFIGWISLVSELRVVALGAIDAKVTRVAAAFPAQIATVTVGCDDQVKAGAVLAVVRNEIMVQQYRTDHARVAAELKQSQHAYEARVAASNEVARAAEHQYRAAIKVSSNVGKLREAMEPLWKRGQITLTDWLEVDNNWLRSQSAEAAAEATWRSKEAEAERARLEIQEQIAGLEARLVEIGKLIALSGGDKLVADIDGIITMCERRPGEVVAAGEPIMEVQSAETPSVLAYVGAADLPRIKIGMEANIYLATREAPLRVTVEALPVQVGRLPGKLKRYFWQGQEWQQYAAVRLVFRGEDRQLVANLRHNERVDILFEMYPSLRIPLWLLNIF